MYRNSGNMTPFYPLQDVLLPIDKSIIDLYVRLLNGYSELDDSRLTMEAGAKVSFNTYFNSFYESYWTTCTSVRDLVIELTCSGNVSIEIFRDSKRNGCTRIEWKKFSSAGFSRRTIRVPLGSTGVEPNAMLVNEPGRIFFDIYAESKAVIKDVSFGTTNAPEAEARVTLGICTYNREAYLYRNLKSIHDHQDELGFVEKVILVNQGPVFANKDLSQLVAKSDMVKLVEQRNLGGCGGFTRTMQESLTHYDATYHVLMDDDAVIDHRMLKNLSHFLSYVNTDLVVGGHMLDLLRPWVLYEAGAMVYPNTRIRSLHHNLDLRRLESMSAFNECSHSDYNAWWFCAIPTRHIEEAQFPAPIFIRGDDMEYGVRLQEMGVKTVAMPGVAVWHEPFYLKVGSWQLYYDLRNRLIMASVYPDRFKLDSPKTLLWSILNFLALHDYLAAALYCRAIQDYLKGPALFEIDSERLHQEVAKLSKTMGQRMAGSEEYSQVAKIRAMPASKRKRGILIVRRLLSLALFGAKNKAPSLLLDAHATLANVYNQAYVKTNGVGSYKLIYEPDRAKMFSVFAEVMTTIKEYGNHKSRVAQTWRDEIGGLRSAERWKEVFTTSEE